jgi:hypothetical protein
MITRITLTPKTEKGIESVKKYVKNVVPRNSIEKMLINNSIKQIEKRFHKKITDISNEDFNETTNQLVAKILIDSTPLIEEVQNRYIQQLELLGSIKDIDFIIEVTND